MSGGGHQLFDPEAPPLSAPEVAAAPDRRAPSGGAEPAPTAERDPGERRGVLSIGGLYEEVEGALGAAFPRNRHLWVRGEIQHISDHRSGHLYMSLVEPGDDGSAQAPRARGGVPTLNVKCWRSSWTPLRHALSKEGIDLAEGMVVVLRGTLDLYRAKGEISLILVEVDVTALLGRMAAQRARLLRALEAEGLLGRNRSLRVPDLSMHVGLIASPGTEGCQDFLGQLTGSGFGFRISLVPVSVQGPHAPAAIARALEVLSRSDCDVIAMVRGGGARADLAAFETEVVARAVARATKPVFTGIGHTGDETVADITAARACITPTECGHQIVVSTRRWWAAHVAEPAELLARRAPGFLSDAQTRERQARSRLTAAARHQVRVHRERLVRKASSIGRSAPSRLESREAAVHGVAARLGPVSLGHLGRQDERLHSWRRLLSAYDVERQLERGYSLTLTAGGALVRSAGDVVEGQEIVTRFADGSVRSTVEGADMRQEPEQAQESED
ncbi:MAG: exodeoxyribonuclease VII large subunit [Acidimicrobiales bacterium]|jgi:exodeoxyribonuclease VII large subunit